MISLESHAPAIRARVMDAIPPYWPGLAVIADRWLGNPGPELLLPLAACEAAGGIAEEATPVAAALAAAEMSLLILDNAYDQDRADSLFQSVGVARAQNFAFVFQSLSFELMVTSGLPSERLNDVLRVASAGFLATAAGQDRDLSRAARNLEEYWAVAEMKTGTGYGAAMEAGAIVAGAAEPARTALRTFGFHMGLAVQIFNDLRGMWMPDGASDLDRGVVTLPIHYALSTDLAERAILEAIIADGQLAAHQNTVLRILESVDARGFMIWAALRHRERALAALDSLPTNDGVRFLTDFITGAFGNIQQLLDGAGKGAAHPEGAKQLVVRDQGDIEPIPYTKTPVYQSTGLSIRDALRRGGE